MQLWMIVLKEYGMYRQSRAGGSPPLTGTGEEEKNSTCNQKHRERGEVSQLDGGGHPLLDVLPDGNGC